VPFSDPMADGPVIQHASERALATKWLKTKLWNAAEFRKPSVYPRSVEGYFEPD